MAERKYSKKSSSRSWDPIADWYTGWVGAQGSEHHREVAIPTLMRLLQPRKGEKILDVGCGPGVLAPYVSRAGAHYTGVDASSKLIAFARKHHGAIGRFILGDATDSKLVTRLGRVEFDAATFLLSIQDIDPLDSVLRNAATTLRWGGRIVILMTHPCFRVPRQSGWGWDDKRRIRYRRIDHYLTPLDVPMKQYGKGNSQATRSYHRPIQEYVDGLVDAGLLIDCIQEIPTHRTDPPGRYSRAERRANREIPLFLGLRAVKRSPPSP